MSGDVTVELVRSLVENLKRAPENWTAFALVLGFDTEKVNSVHGYVYSADGGASGTSASPREIRSAVQNYTDSHYPHGEKLPISLLVQFDRTSGRYEVTFEDSDPTRWMVTPSNFQSAPEELRPKFD